LTKKYKNLFYNKKGDMCMINGVSTQNSKARLKEIKNEVSAPVFMWDSGRTATKVALENNFAHEQVLKNQQKIIENQDKIIRQLAVGQKFNIKA